MELTILMPCLDEAETLKVCIDKAMGYLKRSGVVGEVLIADNGSTDASKQIATDAGARTIDVTEKGYGCALREGISAAQGRFVIMGDADDSYDFSQLDAFVEELRGGAELVMGNRFRGGIKSGAMPALHRYLGNPVLSFIGRLFFPSEINDFHCGLRGFNREKILQLGLTTSGMEFASEMVVKATLHKLHVKEVPTTLSPDGRSREPHLRSWRDGWRHLKFLLLLSPRWLFYYPGLLMTTTGLLAMIWLTISPIQLFGLVLESNTLIFASASLICGTQLLIFSVFSKVVAMRFGLHPVRKDLAGLLRSFRLEYGLILGTLFLLGGIITSVYSLFYWGAHAFGDLRLADSLRIVVPAATSLVLGIQLVFSSFLLGLLMEEQDYR